MEALMARKSLACLSSRHCIYLCKFHASFALSYSTDGGKQPGDAHPTVSEFLMQRHHFSAETASRVTYIPARPKTLARFDSVISFLRETGLSDIQLEETVKHWPKVLSVKLEKTIKPIVRVFRDFGFTSGEIAEIVSKTPKLFQIGADRFTSSLSVLKRVLGSNAEVAKFLKNSGIFFCPLLDNHLVPNIEFLKSCGIPMERIKMLMNSRGIFSFKPETFRKIVQKAEDLGLDMSSPKFIYAVKTVGSKSDKTWELKLDTFRKLGFSDDDILRVFRYSPLVFTVSGKKLKKVKEVLLETGKYDMPCIVNNPTVFHYSIEKRFRPRLQVLTILEKKNLIKEWPSLGTLLIVPNDKFFEMFVAPYLDEVGDLWSAVSHRKQPGHAHRTVSEFLMQRHHFSPETASRVTYVAARPKTLARFDSVISFLKETGLSDIQLEKMVDNWPRVLSVKLEKTIKPIIMVFRDFGFNSDEIAEIISKTPKLFQIGVDRFTSSLSVLKRVLGSNAEVAKFLKNSGNFFCPLLENRLVINIEFLKSCGIPMERIKMLMNFPGVFWYKPEAVRKIVRKAEDLGLDMSSPKFIYAVRTMSSMSDKTWELKLEGFRKLGFSDVDILSVFRYSPLVFCTSEKKLKRVKEVLLETGKYDMPCIVNFPTVFHYSIEKRFRPRLQVLTILEKKNLIKEWPSLGTLLPVPNDKFFEMFVAPYFDEVGDVWSAVSHGNGEVKV